MKTDILTPKELFQKDIRYMVPPFQRRYVWTQEEQWEPLWEDVRNTADDYLEQLEKENGDRVVAEENTKRHFLGAVVVQQVNVAVRDIDQRKVIDGQQRLTTLQLLLDAVQFVCEKHEARGVATRLFKLVTNDKDLVQNNDDIFKLWPTTNDRQAFKHAMDNNLATTDYEDSLIVKAHEYFKSQADQWLGSGTESITDRMEALETAITGMLQTVVIDLSSQDDPHIIFETLNARGTQLLESDLIKNYIISKTAQAEKENIWGELDHDWWRKDLRQGRLLRPRIDALLDYWLEMYKFDDVSAGEVFKTFQEIAPDKQKIEAIMSELKTDLSNYRRYEEYPRKPVEKMFHYRASVMQMGAFTPALLAILSKPDKARFGALQALESFLVRRMVRRDTTKDYNRLALDLVRELNKSNPENADKIVAQFLSRQKAESRRWPTDEDLESSFRDLQLYRLLTRGRLRLILEGIEGKLRENSHAEEQQVPKNLTIEHVLPQKWETHWPLPDDIEEQEASKNRRRLLHTIGNLTLVTKHLNSAASNARWEHKRKTLEEHSVLLMNHNLLAQHKDVAWNEETIIARSRYIAVLVADVWPGPTSTVWAKDE